jgi:4-amino-4-deoxy-L-arabinose transferase-like glycosyltransferase
MKTEIKQNFVRWLPWLIIALGFILRLDQYFLNRSLWLDEAFFAVNIIDRTFLELFEAPLEYTSHIMPPGFLVMAKLSITLFGNSDFILRLFPFVCGVLSLVLFYQLAKVYISAKAVPLALFFFAVSDYLIYYSSEFQQYSSDVMIAIALFLLVAHLRKNTLTFAKLFILTIVGILAVWFSYASVFILATIGIYLILPYLLNKQWETVIELAAVYWVWLLNFAILYFLIINVDTSSNQWLYQFLKEKNAFMPFPFSVEGIQWFQWLYDRFLLVMKYPGSLDNVEIAGCAVIIGCIAMLANRKGALFLLTLPVLIALIVSSFEKYPFHSSFLLFLMPALYLIIAEGIVQFQVKLLVYSKTSIVTVAIQIILVVSLIDFPIHSRQVSQEIKPVLEHVQKNRQDKDIVYLYYWVEPAFRYYANSYHFNYDDCHIITPLPTTNEYTKEVNYFRSKRDLKPVKVNETQCILGIAESFGASRRELNKLRGRVWFIFSHIREHRRNLFLKHLDTRGTRLDENIQKGAFAYLYKL